MVHKWKIKSLKIKILFITLSLTLIVLGVIGLNTYASLKAEDKVANDFSISGHSGQIEEKFVKPETLEPGKEYDKTVSISNKSDTNLLVRVLVTPEIMDADGFLSTSNIGSDLFIDLGSKWLLGEDGYYYYLEVVKPGSSSQPLFTKVGINQDLFNNRNFIGPETSMSIYIKSETIIANSTHYRDAWWLGTIPTDNNLKVIDSTLFNLIN